MRMGLPDFNFFSARSRGTTVSTARVRSSSDFSMEPRIAVQYTADHGDNRCFGTRPARHLPRTSVRGLEPREGGCARPDGLRALERPDRPQAPADRAAGRPDRNVSLGGTGLRESHHARRFEVAYPLRG